MSIKVSKNEDGSFKATVSVTFDADGQTMWLAIRRALQERPEVVAYFAKWGFYEMFPIVFDSSVSQQERNMQMSDLHDNITGERP